MTLTVQPIATRLRRRLFGSRLIHRAVETVEVAPAATIDDPPAITLPGEIDRVLGFAPGAVPELEIAVARGGLRRHPATSSFRLDNALFSGREVWVGSTGEMQASGGPRFVWRGPTERIACAQLCTIQVANLYFAHWLMDSLPLELLAGERGLVPLTIPRPEWAHTAGYRAMSGLVPATPPAARVDQLWMVDDVHLNHGRRARIRALRERLRRPDATSPRRVFLDRGTTGAPRSLVNRDAVIQALGRHGFIELHPERETPGRIAEALSNAELCIGVEGSALAHAVALLPPSATLLVLMPPRRFTALMKSYADAAGMRFAFIVGDETAENEFTIDPERLLATMDLLD